MDATRGFASANASADGVQVPERLMVPFGGAGDSPGKGAVGKTPISLLQEACLRRKLSPVYELISTEGQVHEPVFTYRCSVDGITGQGSGKSKKTAKHLAALGILEEVTRRGAGIEWGIPGGSVSASIAYLATLMPDKTEKRRSGPDDLDEDSNPVGKLQERCSQLKLPAPEYQLEEEMGQPHEKSFKVLVSLGKLKAHSQANTKKAAKRIAAELMLSQIANISTNQGFDEDDLVERLKRGLRGVGKGLKGRGERMEAGAELARLEAFFGALAKGRGRETRALRGPNALPSSVQGQAALRLLSSIAQENNFRLAFLHNLPPKENGQVQCLVQLSTVPVAVCHGTGATETDAQYDAALNALHYIRIMANKA